MDEIRLWTDIRTTSEIRADMFQGGTLANSGNLFARWSLDEGTGTTSDNSEGTSGNDLTVVAGGWASAGTFTYGTSTLTMTGTSKFINYTADETLYNLTIATGGDSNAITFKDIDGGNSGIVVLGTLEQTSGKLASSNVEAIQFGQSYGHLKAASGKGAIAFADVYRFYIYQNSVSGATNFPHADSADNDITTKRLFITSSSTIEAKATGDLTITEELEVGAGNTFNANGNTIAAKLVDVNGGTLNLSNSTLNFSVTSSGDTFDLHSSSTLLTGNTTITGNTSSNTPAYLSYGGDFEVVGDVSNLELQSNSDLTVIGAVTNCTFQSGVTNANIRQWHHTLDTQQLLDADEGGDDDLKLTKPALDNSHELMTG
jgi:hypothetical protein